MTDPAADAARSAAAILAPGLGPNLPAEVEAALAARHAQQRPGQYNHGWRLPGGTPRPRWCVLSGSALLRFIWSPSGDWS